MNICFSLLVLPTKLLYGKISSSLVSSTIIALNHVTGLLLGFSRAVVSACVSGMMVVLVRVQLSVLGAFMYRDLQASRHVSDLIIIVH